jgi:hypothetical protein
LSQTHPLAAILAADVVGYSRVMRADEAARRGHCASIAPLSTRSRGYAMPSDQP